MVGNQPRHCACNLPCPIPQLALQRFPVPDDDFEVNVLRLGRSPFSMVSRPRITVRGLIALVSLIGWTELGLFALFHILPNGDSIDQRNAWIIAGGMALAGVSVLLIERGPIRPWIAYLCGWLLFTCLRYEPWDLGLPMHWDYPRAALSWLPGGDPSFWLQHQLYRQAQPGPLDVAMAVLWLSAPVVIHVAAFVLWRAESSRLRPFVTAVLIVLGGALVTGLLVPTAPPWLAGLNGHGDHVSRVLIDLMYAGNPEAYRASYQVHHLADLSSMPSVPVALAVVLCFSLGRVDAAVRSCIALYAALVGLAAIYLGEAAVLDVLGGVGVGLLAAAIAAATWRMVHAEDEIARRDAELLLAIHNTKRDQQPWMVKPPLWSDLNLANAGSQPAEPDDDERRPRSPAWVRWVIRAAALAPAVVFFAVSARPLIDPLVQGSSPRVAGLGTFDPYLYREGGERADPVNLVFQVNNGHATTEAAMLAITKVLGWPDMLGSEMTFREDGRDWPTASHLGIDLAGGVRVHMRVQRVAVDDQKTYVLAAVHRDDIRTCGHVGRAMDEMRDFVGRSFARSGYSVKTLLLSNSDPAKHCDGSLTTTDGFATLIEITPQGGTTEP